MHAIDAQLSVTAGLENTLKAQVEADGRRLRELREIIQRDAPDAEIRVILNELLDSNAKLTGVLKSFDAVANTPEQAPLDDPASHNTTMPMAGERYDSATDDALAGSGGDTRAAH
jgi:hypothetical protein